MLTKLQSNKRGGGPWKVQALAIKMGSGEEEGGEKRGEEHGLRRRGEKWKVIIKILICRVLEQ